MKAELWIRTSFDIYIRITSESFIASLTTSIHVYKTYRGNVAIFFLFFAILSEEDIIFII